MPEDVANKAYGLLAQGTDIVVATVVETHGSSPRHVGSYMVFSPDGRSFGTIGGGKVEGSATRDAMEAFRTREMQRVYHYGLHESGRDALGMACGGDAYIKIEYFDAAYPERLNLPRRIPETALIFGAGHVGKALAPILEYVGFYAIVLDDRAEYANEENIPGASEVRVIPSFADSFNTQETDENTYIVIVTRGHKSDYEVLRAAIELPHAYLGMMGSKQKVRKLLRQLRDEKVCEELIESLYTPIGEPILAETPEELAISIAGQMIRVRAERRDT